MNTLATEHFTEETMDGNYNRDRISRSEKPRYVRDKTVDSDESNSSGFDCNICLDFVQEPVITLCGHLFCWPCIYKWLQQQLQCPVCKAEVSGSTLVPLFGRGRTSKPSKTKAPNLGIIVPKRPQSFAYGFDSPSSSQQSYLSYAPRVSASTQFDTVIGMFGEMIYKRVFGNSVADIYGYPDSYNLAGSASPRLRRHVMEADKSLRRICFFVFCCVFWCFLSF